MSISPEEALKQSQALRENDFQAQARKIIDDLDKELNTNFYGQYVRTTTYKHAKRVHDIVREHYADHWTLEVESIGSAHRFTLWPKKEVSIDVRPKQAL